MHCVEGRSSARELWYHSDNKLSTCTNMHFVGGGGGGVGCSSTKNTVKRID